MLRERTSSRTAHSWAYYATASPNTRQFLRAAEHLQANGKDQEAANSAACGRRFGGTRLVNGHCRWTNNQYKAEIRALTPYAKCPIGCTKHHGRQLNHQPPRTIRELCVQKKIHTFHFSCFRDDVKLLRMKQAGLWFVNKETAASCKYN